MNRRATLAGEIEQYKQGIVDREEMLSHPDATRRALDPSYRADTVAPYASAFFRAAGTIPGALSTT